MSRVYKAIDLRRVEARSQNPFLAVKVLTVPFDHYFGSLAVAGARSRQAAEPDSSEHRARHRRRSRRPDGVHDDGVSVRRISAEQAQAGQGVGRLSREQAQRIVDGIAARARVRASTRHRSRRPEAGQRDHHRGRRGQGHRLRHRALSGDGRRRTASATPRQNCGSAQCLDAALRQPGDDRGPASRIRATTSMRSPASLMKCSPAIIRSRAAAAIGARDAGIEVVPNPAHRRRSIQGDRARLAIRARRPNAVRRGLHRRVLRPAQRDGAAGLRRRGGGDSWSIGAVYLSAPNGSRVAGRRSAAADRRPSLSRLCDLSADESAAPGTLHARFDGRCRRAAAASGRDRRRPSRSRRAKSRSASSRSSPTRRSCKRRGCNVYDGEWRWRDDVNWDMLDDVTRRTHPVKLRVVGRRGSLRHVAVEARPARYIGCRALPSGSTPPAPAPSPATPLGATSVRACNERTSPMRPPRSAIPAGTCSPATTATCRARRSERSRANAFRPARHDRQRFRVGAGLLAATTIRARPPNGSARHDGDCGSRENCAAARGSPRPTICAPATATSFEHDYRSSSVGFRVVREIHQ